MLKALDVDAKSQEDICNWMIDYLAKKLRIDRAEIDINTQFIDYGLDSVDSMKIVGELEDYLGFELSPSLPYEYPTIETLATALAEAARLQGARQ